MENYKVTIKEQHLDVFMHVNNATVLTLLEEARWDYITRNGHGLIRIQQEKKGPVILEAHIKYKKEMCVRDQVEIDFEIIEYRSKIGRLKQNIYRDGEICVEAEYVIGFFDLKKRKLIEPTESWKKAIGLI